MVHVEEEIEFGENIELKNLTEKLVEETCRFVGCDYECDVELLITDEHGIQNINKCTRNIDAPTDVLSFPYIEYSEVGKIPEENLLDFHPETGELLLGQIVICESICKRQAKEYGHRVVRELAFLITHSLLHLFGYDHMEKNDEEKMCKAQEIILENLGYTR